MKKIIVLVLMVILNFSLFGVAHAQTGEKSIDVEIKSTAVTVNVGEKVTVTAESVKHGSGYINIWTGAKESGTFLDTDTGKYVSAATFTADKPGTYEIGYDITMNAGKSNTVFKGSGTCIIEVKGEAEIVGAEIGDVSMDTVFRPDGRLEGYSAMGNVYIIKSDNTKLLYSTMFFFFEPDEYRKDMDVTIEEQGRIYKFTVSALR